jgi:hypothetical protein
MDTEETSIAGRQAQLTAWFTEEAEGLPGCNIEHSSDDGKYEYAWKVYLNDVQMGIIILTNEVTLPEDKIRAHSGLS